MRHGDGGSRFIRKDEQELIILVWTRLYCSCTAHAPINPHNMEKEISCCVVEIF